MIFMCNFCLILFCLGSFFVLLGFCLFILILFSGRDLEGYCKVLFLFVGKNEEEKNNQNIVFEIFQ